MAGYIHIGTYGKRPETRQLVDLNKKGQASDKLCGCGKGYRQFTQTGTLKSYCATCEPIKARQYRLKIRKGKQNDIR